MGDMADLAAEEYYASLAEQEYGLQKHKRSRLYKTEDVLNRSNWVDGQGAVHELKDMDRDHLQNVLFFIYRRRDRYWLNCKDVSLIEKFKDGDEFFQSVIRSSTIWKAIIAELQRPVEGFNFEYTVPGEDRSNWEK
ncbi:hypothetical protein [Sediminibacillus sp. JSM 1682029]|uniref:hypothetical protein n=1 Tax=Sediminibacillus sp. JSM 1682029 TaxID=3229857 RepID=UPI0035233766